MNNNQTPPLSRNSRRFWTVFLLTLALLALLTHDTVFWAGNDASRFAQIEALVDFGAIHIDESWYRWSVDRVMIDGHDYSNKPPLLSLIGAGVYFILKHVFELSFAGNEGLCAYWLTLIVIGVSVAWLTARFDAALAIYDSIRPAVRTLTTLALAAGTLVTVFAVTFTNHSVAAATLFAACYAAWLGSGLAAGVWLALTICVDIVPGVVFAPVLAGVLYLAGHRWRVLSGYLAALVSGAAAFVGIDWLVLGSPWPPKMVPGAVDHSGIYPAADGSVQLNVPFHFFPEDWLYPLACLFGWHGFFTVSPVLLFGVMGMGRALCYGSALGRSRSLLLAAGCAVTIAGHVLFIGTFGGWSYGYRYLVPIMPVMLFFAPLVLVGWRVWVFGAVLAVSILFTLLGAYHPWPPVFEPEYANTAHEDPYASLVANPIGGNAAAWLAEYFPDTALAAWAGSVFIDPNPRLRGRYLLLFYQSKGYKELP